MYYAICSVWPTQNQKTVREMGLGWEEMGKKEIVAVDGTVISDELDGYPDPRLQGGDEKWGGHVVGDSDSPPRR